MNLTCFIDCLQTFLTNFMLLYTYHKILKAKKPVVSILAVSILQTLIYYLTCYSPTIIKLLSEDLRMTIKTLFVVPVFIIFGLFLCDSTIIKRFQAVLCILISTFISELVLTSLYITIFHVDLSNIREESLENRIIIGIITLFLYLISCSVSYFICKYKTLKLPSKIIAMFVSMFFVLAFMFTLVTINAVQEGSTITKFTIAIAIVSTTFIMYVVYKMLVRLNEQEVLKEKLFWSENLQTIQLSYYDSIKEKTSEIRQIRHDFKDQLETIRKLINKNTDDSINAATEILNELNHKIDSTSFHYFTDNLIVNTVIGIKIEECKNTNIQWDIKLDLPETIQSIESIDLNCLFINLLNNAVEACVKLKSKNPKIVIRAVTKSNHLIIKVENPFEEIIINDSGKLITTKDDKSNHGVGMLLIENIAKKYNGFYEIKTENNVFKSIVTIPYKSA